MGNVMMEASQINYRGGESKMSVEQALKETSGEAAAIAALQEAVGNLQSGKANLSVIAPAFSAETAYAVGDIVTYDGATYRCTTAHEGAWDATDFTATTISGELASLSGDVSDLNSTKANQITIAPFFSAETAYDPGDLVYYNGLTYRCTNAHEGAWDAQDFAATTIANELSSLESGLIDVNSKITCDLLFEGAPTVAETFETLTLSAGVSNYKLIMFLEKQYSNVSFSLIEPRALFDVQTNNGSRVIIDNANIEAYKVSDTSVAVKMARVDNDRKIAIYGLLK